MYNTSSYGTIVTLNLYVNTSFLGAATGSPYIVFICRLRCTASCYGKIYIYIYIERRLVIAVLERMIFFSNEAVTFSQRHMIHKMCVRSDIRRCW